MQQNFILQQTTYQSTFVPITPQDVLKVLVPILVLVAFLLFRYQYQKEVQKQHQKKIEPVPEPVQKEKELPVDWLLLDAIQILKEQGFDGEKKKPKSQGEKKP